MNISDLLHIMIDKKSSDMHLKEGRTPILRIDGRLTNMDMEILSAEDMKDLIYALTDEKMRKKFEETNEMDLAYNLEGVARFRANAFKQMGKLEMVLRAIPIKIPTIEELSLPSILQEISLYPRGLVLVTGTTGSGKSTCLAAMINKINESYAHHIVTIEDPIEFVHADKKCSVTQREVGLDTESFGSALKYVLRQDPDVILIGEMRDSVTVATAISAAETGHMVFSTLHTMDTVQTINRVLDFFPKEQQAQVRVQLAGALRAVVCLRLVTKADGVGRVPAVEVMIANQTVRGYIEEGKIGSIKDLIKDGSNEGMQSFDQSLIKLYKQGFITVEEAKRSASSPQEIDLAMKGITSSRSSAQSILDTMMKEQTNKELISSLKEAKKLEEQSRFKEAYALYEKMLNKYPDSGEAAQGLEKMKSMLNSEQHQQNIKGILMEGLNIYKKGNIEGAIVKWQEGLSVDPNNPQILAYIKSAKEKLEIAGNIPNIMNEGLEFYKTGKISDAINKWNEVLKLDPANVQAISYVSGANQKMQEVKEKKELAELTTQAEAAQANGDDLSAMLFYKRALDVKPEDEELKKKFDASYKKLKDESFGGGDVESALTSEAFGKGIDKMLAEDYIGGIKEFKKAIEKRPLEKKLKDYVEKVKGVLKARLENLMERAEESYRVNDIVDTMNCVNTILKIDVSNDFALKYVRDLKPAVEAEVKRTYAEAMDLLAQEKLKETREKLFEVLRLEPNNMSANKRLEEVSQRINQLDGA